MIGLFGGTCNNMYVMAKFLARHDHSVCFIEDRSENFPHSQPVWDDVDVHFRAGFDYRAIDWSKFESEYNWVPPEWYFKPRRLGGGALEVFKESPAPLIVKVLACRYLRTYKEVHSVFKKMMECDHLIVCGIRPAIIAMLTGKPYMIFPHGSDMRVAVGVERKGSGFKGRMVEWLVSRSFESAKVIGSSLPTAGAPADKNLYRRLCNLTVSRLPLPYDSVRRLPDFERRAALRLLFKEIDVALPAAKYYCFTPSRINFHWKGHDRLLRAVKQYQGELNIHFIFLGWGDDYSAAVDYVNDNHLAGLVTVLPLFLSKKFLLRFFSAVDFMIDSLNGAGGYGTSLSEAMSVGCPVVTWISDIFDQPGWERPPVMQACTEEELGSTMRAISRGSIDLSQQSAVMADWFFRVHSGDVVLKSLENELLG